MTDQKKAWNKGKIVGRKPPLTPEQVATIRTLLSQEGNLRDIAMFALAIDSSLRGSDIVALNVSDILSGSEIKERVTLEQRKTHQRVSFGMRDYTRVALKEWIEESDKAYGDPLFTSLKGNVGGRLKVDTYQRYLGIDEEQALDIAKQFEI